MAISSPKSATNSTFLQLAPLLVGHLTAKKCYMAICRDSGIRIGLAAIYRRQPAIKAGSSFFSRQ
jgi:hypothetical protein